MNFSDAGRSGAYQSLDAIAVFKQLAYWCFLLFSLAVFLFGVLAVTGKLPKYATPAVLKPISRLLSPDSDKSDSVWLTPDYPSAQADSAKPDSANFPDRRKTIQATARQADQVRQIQALLSELGYQPGPVDGIWGKKTERALTAFRKDNRIADSNRNLTQILSSLQDYIPEANSLPDGYSGLKIVIKNDAGASASQASTPAPKPERRWECARGYRKTDTSCIKIELPEKAYLTPDGNNWQCITGYKKQDGRCLPYRLPSNAFVNYTENGWECIRGYVRVNNQCVLHQDVKQAATSQPEQETNKSDGTALQ